ncbi:MAG: metal-dependent hydrolase [Gammaproteobacteria bacterium]|nr:metal-dependent hydrolase [Gammaproteobacteria bacterium]
MSATAAHQITPRRQRFAFCASTPVDWFRESRLLTAVLNAYSLLVPDNERYYIRILQQHLHLIDDPELRGSITAFIRQEAQHGIGHEAHWALLRTQGVDVDSFTRVANRVLYKIIEPIIPLPVHLSIVAAIEHINASFGQVFLSRNLMADAAPAIGALFDWHFAEEIEHKAVAFDVLKACHRSYFIRLAGALLAFPMFATCISVGSLWLLARDRRPMSWRKELRTAWRFWISERVLPDLFGQLLLHLKPGFHPWDDDNSNLARAILEPIDAALPAEIGISTTSEIVDNAQGGSRAA